MTLTASKVRDAAPRASTYEIPDEKGLVLRITPGGTKSWSVFYWESGRKRRKTVGRWPSVSLKDARGLRDSIKARTAGESSMTFAQFAEVYLERWARPRKRSAAEDERMLRRDVIPVIGSRPVSILTRRECVAVLDRIQDRGAPDMAARTKALLRRVMQFAVEREVRDDNPAREIVARQSPARQRVLEEKELRVWWRELTTGEVPPRVVSVLSLQLATGQRLGEVLSMEADDLDLVAERWTIPGEKAKNGVTHTVPLTAWARSLIDEAMARPRRPGRPKYVFDVSAVTVREWMRSVVQAANLKRATPHDLRRTVATFLGELRFDRNIQDRILNHIDQSVGATYDRYSYDAEKREALEAWAGKFAEITGANVPKPAPPEHETSARNASADAASGESGDIK